jgi:hypothetical protein
VREIPIVFRDRRVGTSKMSWRIALEAALLVPQIRLSKSDSANARVPAPGGGRSEGTTLCIVSSQEDRRECERNP